jgi:hypothetical protein
MRTRVDDAKRVTSALRDARAGNGELARHAIFVARREAI